MAPEPTTLTGYMDESIGISGYSMVVDYLLENTPELRHPDSVYTFARMRHDAQLAAVLEAYSAPIQRAKWSLDPAGARDEVVAHVADDLGLPIKGYDDDQDDDDPSAAIVRPSGARRRRFTWAEHLRLAGLDRVYGHMFFEQAYAARDGRWHLDVVQERMPHTIFCLNLNPDGTLKSVQQSAITSRQSPPITTADHRLVYYTRKREGSNYFGQSLLRPSYAPWLIKDQMLRVHATSIRRFGMGVPEVQAPPGATQGQILEAQRLASSIRAGEGAGVGLPNGFTYALRGLQGSIPNVVEFITLLDRYMTRSTLTSLLDMAAAERGNRSLGETVMDLMIMAQQADAEFHAEVGTQQIVIPLVDANWGEDEPSPQICVGNVGADVETTAQDIYWLTAYAGLKPDAPARAWIRQQRGIPPEDPDDPIFAVEPPNPSQPDPNAPPTRGGQQ